MTPSEMKELVEKVIEQIRDDLVFSDNDTTSLETLLLSCPIESLEAYLPEEY